VIKQGNLAVLYGEQVGRQDQRDHNCCRATNNDATPTADNMLGMCICQVALY